MENKDSILKDMIILSWGVLVFIIVGVSIYVVSQIVFSSHGPATTYVFGGSWAEQMIRENQTFIDTANPDTLRLAKVYYPWDSSMLFTYCFEYNDTNDTRHTVIVMIGQDAGSWKNGPFFDEQGY